MNERIKFTDVEKMAMNNNPEALGMMFMGEDINTAIEKDNIRRFNNQVDEYTEKLAKREDEVNKIQESLKYSVDTAEIKPMFSRILIKPFAHNPFQKMVVENGLIIDSGEATIHAELNPNTGKYEEPEQWIVNGAVVDAGPECKYLKEGDVVYYRKDTAVPVPFFKSGLVSINENQVIACVAEGLTERFANGK